MHESFAAMSLFSFVNAFLGFFIPFTTAYVSLDSKLVSFDEVSLQRLETRQASGVIATSQFLRRGSHACQ